MKRYDVVIVGAGPSGVTAAIYLKRAGINFALIESYMIGGKVNLTADIDNYPPYKHISGIDLAASYLEDLKHNEIKPIYDEVKSITKQDDLFNIKLLDSEIEAKAVLVCSGTREKVLGVKGEEKYLHRGISFCAVCDGNLYRNKPMAVVGGGNSALEEALYLASITNKVYVIHRRNEFRGSNQYVELLKNNPNVEILTPYEIEECLGENKLQSLKLINKEDNSIKEINVEALFEYVGLLPNSDFVNIEGVKDSNGFIKVNENMETECPGLFASGDITTKKLRQVVVASGDGALATATILDYLRYSK